LKMKTQARKPNGQKKKKEGRTDTPLAHPFVLEADLKRRKREKR